MFNAHSVTGLTGGMGSGKSTVSAMLPSLGYVVIDADQLTRTVHHSPEVCEKLRRAFGPDVIDHTTQAIHRPTLARYAFASDATRQQLNDIMQPALRAAALQAIQQANAPVILDAPLLFEAAWDDMTQQNVVVLCPEHIRFQRIQARDNLPSPQIRARLNAQLSDLERCQKADFLIYNCSNIENLKIQVLRIFG